MNEPSNIPTQDLEGACESSDTQQEPLYVRLFEKTKRYSFNHLSLVFNVLIILSWSEYLDCK